jgi:transcription antitermination protein NusB
MTQTAVPTSRQKSSARLHAVQAVYQMLLTGQGAGEAMDGHAETVRTSGDPDMAAVEIPSNDLYCRIVSGVERMREELAPVIQNHLKNGATFDSMVDQEPLLVAILLCGSVELMNHLDIDAPVIINDYVQVTKSYYEGKESNLINAILDQIKALYRSVMV